MAPKRLINMRLKMYQRAVHTSRLPLPAIVNRDLVVAGREEAIGRDVVGHLLVKDVVDAGGGVELAVDVTAEDLPGHPAHRGLAEAARERGRAFAAGRVGSRGSGAGAGAARTQREQHSDGGGGGRHCSGSQGQINKLSRCEHRGLLQQPRPGPRSSEATSQTAKWIFTKNG